MAKTKKAKEATNPEVIKDPMTHIVEVKRPYTDKEIVEFAHKIADACEVITDEEMERKASQDAAKIAIEEQEEIIQDCAFKVRKGYEMMLVACSVTYDGKIATFTNKETGEIVEQRELSQEEQLRLASQWKDAEEVIRADSKKDE